MLLALLPKELISAENTTIATELLFGIQDQELTSFTPTEEGF